MRVAVVDSAGDRLLVETDFVVMVEKVGGEITGATLSQGYTTKYSTAPPEIRPVRKMCDNNPGQQVPDSQVQGP